MKSAGAGGGCPLGGVRSGWKRPTVVADSAALTLPRAGVDEETHLTTSIAPDHENSLVPRVGQWTCGHVHVIPDVVEGFTHAKQTKPAVTGTLAKSTRFSVSPVEAPAEDSARGG